MSLSDIEEMVLCTMMEDCLVFVLNWEIEGMLKMYFLLQMICTVKAFEHKKYVYPFQKQILRYLIDFKKGTMF